MMRLRLLRSIFGVLLPVLAAMAPAIAEDSFTVAGVHVDASGASALEARNQAIASGRVQAWQTLFRRLARQQDWPRQPPLSAEQLQRYVSSFFPTSEKRSTTRYVADVTYIFNRDAIARLMQSAKIAYSVVQAKRVLLIPMAPNFAHGSSWTSALSNPRLAGGIVPFVLPMGDAQDATALNGLSFETADWTDVAASAERRGAAEAVLVEAHVSGDKMLVSLKRLSPHHGPVKVSAESALLPGGAASSYAGAADLAVRTMEDMWKNRTAVDYSRKSVLTLDIALNDGLEGLATLQKRLLAAAGVADVTVSALNIGQASLSLTYQGSTEQLQDTLSQSGFTLSRHGEIWQLTPLSVAHKATP